MIFSFSKEEIDVIFEEISGTLHGREDAGMLSSRWIV